MIEVILFAFLLIIWFKYGYHIPKISHSSSKENKIARKVDKIPSNRNMSIDNDDVSARIDNYRHKFFEFHDRINHNTHLDDPVDMINMMDKGQSYELGTHISNIYDDLTNKNNYKKSSTGHIPNLKK